MTPRQDPGRAPSSTATASTWNDAVRIAEYRAMSPARRLALTIEVSRAALRFAHGARHRDR